MSKQALFIFVFFLFAFSVNKVFCQNIFDTEHSLEYASFLENQNEFILAAQEYERIIFMTPVVDKMKMKLVNLYEKSGQTEKAITSITRFYNNESEIPDVFARKYCALLIDSKQFQKADSFLLHNKMLTANEKYFYSLNSQMLDRKWKEASITIKKCDSAKTSNFKDYRELLHDALNVRFKSPALALGLSAVIPGLGKVYTNNAKDGLVTLLFFSMSAFEAYRGFDMRGKKSIYGWVYSAVSVGFYTGSLYGSFISAKKYNKKILQALDRRAEELFSRSQ